jgi:hypothetical protein
LASRNYAAEASALVLQYLIEIFVLLIIMVRKTSQMSYSVSFLLGLLLLASSFLFPARHLANAHTFSTSESAQFLSLVDQIRAETSLVIMNLESGNVTLAQAHAQKAATLPDNFTISEIRERNNRIADSLVTGLEQIEENVTSLASESQKQVPEDRIQSINQSVTSLNDVLAEAVTVRVESEQQNNATTWAMVLADLTNVVLSNYGNATGASFDLTNMSNLPGMEGMEMDHASNMTTMNGEHIQMSSNSSDNNTMIITANATSSISNMTTTIVNTAAYQSAQYLANNTILQLFNDMLKPLTISANETSIDDNNASAVAQQGQDNLTSDNNNNMTSNIARLESDLLQLMDDINGKVTPHELMTTVHLGIHPLLIQLYGLTIEHEGGEESHADHVGG